MADDFDVDELLEAPYRKEMHVSELPVSVHSVLSLQAKSALYCTWVASVLGDIQWPCGQVIRTRSLRDSSLLLLYCIWLQTHTSYLSIHNN